MALAMESPAHPYEELGVTRLWIEARDEGQRGCGHLFCRRWLASHLFFLGNLLTGELGLILVSCSISKWIAGGVSHASLATN